MTKTFFITNRIGSERHRTAFAKPILRVLKGNRHSLEDLALTEGIDIAFTAIEPGSRRTRKLIYYQTAPHLDG